MLHYKSLGLLFLTLLAGLTSLTECKTKKPPSDPTPPIAKWSILNKATNQTQVITGNGGPIQVNPGDFFVVTFIVEDPEGVHQITLGGGGSYSCKSGSLGQTVFVDQVTDVQDLNPDSNGYVLTKIFLIRNVDLNAWSCQQSGYVFTGGSLTLIGTGENYYNGSTTADLTFQR